MNKIKLKILICLSVFISITGVSNSYSQTNARPNIIFIMADDLGYETLECNGGQSYKTPHLNNMAKNGMRFTNAHSTPLCSPSRVQLMTGKYNFRNYKGFGILDSSEVTFGHLLKEAGYVTGITGKWQLYGDKGQQKLAGQKGTVPTKAGFDEQFVWQIDTKDSRYKDPGIYSDKGNQVYKDQYGPNLFADFAKKFIKEHRDTTFFLYYPMVLTHDPFQPTADDKDFPAFDVKVKYSDTRHFSEMVTFMDKKIGEIIQTVHDAGISKNTLIIFTGDNGTSTEITSMLNGKAVKGGKGHPKITGTHVPFIAYWDGVIKQGQVNTNLVDFTDILPTFLQASGKKIPSTFKTDGLSLYDQLTGKPKAKYRDWIYCYYDLKWANFKPAAWIHNKEWKLYETGEFYNLKNDPEEKNPLQDKNPKVKKLKKKLQKEMLSIRKS